MMRREIVFILVGFLAGFAAAGIVFWQPLHDADQPGAGSVAKAAKAPAPADDGGSRRRTTVKASENRGDAPTEESAPQPKSTAEIFHEAIGKLMDMDGNSRKGIIEALSKQLRSSGPEGVQAMRDYLRTGPDVTFPPNGFVVVDGKMVHSLRTALLDSLGDWPAGVANEIALEVLRGTSRRADASIAIRLLEKNAPGAYRTEAIAAFQQLAGKPFEKGDWLTNDMLFDTMKRFKATELLPAAEAVLVLGNDALETARFITSLDALPPDVRAGALQRLFANEAVTKYLPANPWALRSLNYAEPILAQNMAHLFAANADKKFREDFVSAIGQTENYGGVVETTGQRVATLQARAAFLDTIALQCNTPVLQERLQDARAALQKAIANPDDNVLTLQGSGTLIISGKNASSGGTTTFSSGTLEVAPSAEKK